MIVTASTADGKILVSLRLRSRLSLGVPVSCRVITRVDLGWANRTRKRPTDARALPQMRATRVILSSCHHDDPRRRLRPSLQLPPVLQASPSNSTHPPDEKTGGWVLFFRSEVHFLPCGEGQRERGADASVGADSVADLRDSDPRGTGLGRHHADKVDLR
jgi:hypothetical protein